MKIVILAGGSGSRLWPVSRDSYPKHLQAILGNSKETLLQRTYQRLLHSIKSSDILIVTGKSQAKDVLKQIPKISKKNLLIEPVRKESAGAIGLAAARVFANDPEEILMSVASDHWIESYVKFANIIKRVQSILSKYPTHTLTMGIKPTYPETGYGYIQLNKKVVHNKSYKVYTVKKFIEKPELNKAQKFIKQSDYFWNPSWPAWRVDHLMSLYKKFLPKNYSILNKVSKAPETTLQKIINTEFPKLDSVAIDYGILEKAKDLLVMPTDIGWTDIGHWRSVAEMSKTDKDGNTVVGTSVLLDSSNNFLMSNSKKMIAAVGVKDLIMVETSDVVLLIEKSRAQEVKSIVQELRKKKKMKKYL